MAARTFTFAQFTPPLWPHHNALNEALAVAPANETLVDEPSANAVVMSVSEEASDEVVNRDELRTIIESRQLLRGGFRLYNARHDVLVRVRDVYSSDASDDADSDGLKGYCFAKLQRFPIYEFLNGMEGVYAATSLTEIRRLFLRHRNFTQQGNTSLLARTTDLHELERCLSDMVGVAVDIHGYDLLGVGLSTHITRMDVDADHATDNIEIQAAKNRAEGMRHLKLYVQAPDRMVGVHVSAAGSVVFREFPGDETAMLVLGAIEPALAVASSPRQAIGRARLA